MIPPGIQEAMDKARSLESEIAEEILWEVRRYIAPQWVEDY